MTRARAAAAMGMLAVVVWAGIWVRAWDTWVGMNHATGTVAALADAALHGESDGHEGASDYLGALYAPPFPLAVAALYRTGLSWLHALRLASLGSAIAFLAAAAFAARAASASRAGIAVTLALLAACAPFHEASLAGRADLLAAAFTLAAVAAWLRDRELEGWACAALAAAAWLCKVSEVAAPLAVLASAIARRDAGPALRFGLRFALAVALGLLLMLPFQGPSWFAHTLSTTLFSPPNRANLLRGPAEALRYAGSFVELGLIAALALASLADPGPLRGGRDVGPLRWGAAAALLVAMAVLANRGADHNHLLTTLALAGACAGAAWEATPARALSLAAVLVAVPAASWRDAASFARQIAAPAARRANVIAAVRSEPGPVLAEDPLVLLAAGRRSPISDPATLRSRERSGDPRARLLSRATAEGRWSLVVLEHDAALNQEWYRDFHFGEPVMSAVRARYRRDGSADDYLLYRRSGPPPPP